MSYFSDWDKFIEVAVTFVLGYVHLSPQQVFLSSPLLSLFISGLFVGGDLPYMTSRRHRKRGAGNIPILRSSNNIHFADGGRSKLSYSIFWISILEAC